MRGDLDSCPIGDVLGEAQHLNNAGVKGLLVISQDTSVYGVDVNIKRIFWAGMPVKPICWYYVNSLVIKVFGLLCITYSAVIAPTSIDSHLF